MNHMENKGNNSKTMLHILNGDRQAIRDDRCGNCRWSEYENDEQQSGMCHFNPPAVVTIPQQDRITGQVKINVQSVFAPVDRLSWCAHWMHIP